MWWNMRGWLINTYWEAVLYFCWQIKRDLFLVFNPNAIILGLYKPLYRIEWRNARLNQTNTLAYNLLFCWKMILSITIRLPHLIKAKQSSSSSRPTCIKLKVEPIMLKWLDIFLEKRIVIFWSQILWIWTKLKEKFDLQNLATDWDFLWWSSWSWSFFFAESENEWMVWYGMVWLILIIRSLGKKRG